MACLNTLYMELLLQQVVPKEFSDENYFGCQRSSLNTHTVQPNTRPTSMSGDYARGKLTYQYAGGLL